MQLPPTEELRALSKPEFDSFFAAWVVFGDAHPRLKDTKRDEAYALIQANWTLLTTDHTLPVWQWRWRRPIRPNSRDRCGKQFATTGMAYRNLCPPPPAANSNSPWTTPP